MKEKPKLTLEEVCEILQLPDREIELRVECGRLKATMVDGNMLFEPSEIRSYARLNNLKQNKWKVFAAICVILALISVVVFAGLKIQDRRMLGAYKTRAEQALKKNDLASAKTYYEKVVSLDSQDIRAHLALASVYRRLDMTDEMFTQYQAARKIDPGNLELLENLCAAYFESGDISSAQRECRSVLKKKPAHLLANYLMGSIMAHQKDYDAALAFFQKALTAQPDFKPARDSIADIYSVARQLDEAATLLDDLSALDNSLISRLNMAIQYDKSGEPLKAEALYGEIIDQSPVLARAFNNLAWHLIQTDKPSEEQLKQAFDMVKRALILAPDDPSALDTLGWVYFLNADYESAEKYLRQAAERNPDSALIAFHLARTLLKRNKENSAAQEFQRARKLNDDSSELARETLDLYLDEHSGKGK